MKTRAQALRDLGEVIADSAAISRRLSPEDAARRAWHPAGPSIEDLTREITAARERGFASGG